MTERARPPRIKRIDTLRRPFLVIGIILAWIVLGLDIGNLLFHEASRAPGLGVPYTALVDAVMVFTLMVFGASLVLPQAAVGKLQGIATLVFSIILLLTSIGLAFAAFGQLVLMVSWLLGTITAIAYFAIYGHFDRGAASAILSLTWILKIAIGILLVAAEQRFLENRRLILLWLSTLVVNVIVSFLQSLLPTVFVSITDAIAAIVVAIVAIIWAVVLLIAAIPAVLHALMPRVPRPRAAQT